MAQKKQERATREALKRERQARKQNYLEDDTNFISFSNQLAAQGLKLKDIPGDGNCLFRALADQFEGDMSQHMRHRRKVVNYIVQHRKEFEPFVEDGMPFERYVRNLGENGAFGGNDVLVAFARLHRVNIIIHQLNEPCWQVTGTSSSSSPELHVSYHNGDHYSSVRQITDAGEGPGMVEQPVKKESRQADRKQGKDQPKCSQSVEATVCNTDMIETVTAATHCTDLQLIEQTLVDTEFDLDATVGIVLQLMDFQDTSEGSQDKPESSQGTEPTPLKASASCRTSSQADKQSEVKAKMNDICKSTGKSKSRSDRVQERLQEDKHVSNRQRKEKVKRNRKERRMEEQRQQARERHQPNSEEDNNVGGTDRMTADFGMLSI